jgi:hypothetical protein
VRHPFIFGLVGAIFGIVFWSIGVYKYTNSRYQAVKNTKKLSWNDARNGTENSKEHIKFNLQESLLSVQKHGRLIIVLDGLDKLSGDNAKFLNWLPVLPESMKLVLSTVKDDAVMEHFKGMNYQIIEMPVLDAENIPDLFKLVLERLEKSNTGKKEFVRNVFSLLCVSQEGLYENEILTLTGNRPLCWSQLFNGMANHLIIRGGRVTFAHNFIREAAKSRYLPQKTEEKQFREKIVMLMKNDTISDNRNYDELSRQYFELENWDDLYNLLLNFSVTDYLLQNNEDYFSKYWRALLDIDKQKYDIGKYLDLDTQGRNTKEVSAFFTKMSLFAAESLFDSSVSAKFTRKSMELTDEKYAKQNVS